MKSNYYHAVLVMFAVGIFYTNVPLYLYDQGGWRQLEAPKHWMLIFWLLSSPILLRHMKVWDALKSPIMIWCMGYAWVTVLWFLLSSQSEATWQEVRNRLFAIGEITVFLMLFWGPDAIRLTRKTLAGCVLFSIALNIYEVFAPMSFSLVLGRSAGFFMNPNLAGEALVLGMILSVTVLLPRYRGPFVLLVGVGTVTTFSRASIVAWGIAVAGLLFTRAVPSKNLLWSGLLGLALGGVLLLPRLDAFLTTWEQTGAINVNVLERLEWFTDPSGVDDRSSSQRKYLAQVAWDKIADRPFLGNGTGSFNDATILPHNQYLSFMLDHGLIGVLIVPLLMLAAMWGARGEMRHVAIIFASVFMLLSLFTHHILNVQYSLLLISLSADMVATSRNQKSQWVIAVNGKPAVTASGLAGA